MNNEILEISQWLHEKGFEADLYYKGMDLKKEHHWTTAKQKVEYDGYYCPYTPYFTLNRALELLPNVIEKKDYITKEAAPQYIEPYPGYKQACGLSKKTWDKLEEGFHSEKREDVIFCLDKNDLNYHYYDNMGSLGTLFEDQDIKDYHLAALRLLKKTVEEGYVKAN